MPLTRGGSVRRGETPHQLKMNLAQMRANILALMQKVGLTQNQTPAANAEADIAALAADVTTLQGQVAELTQLRADLATARQTIGTLNGQVKEKDAAIAEQAGKITELNTKVTTLESTIADPKGAIELEVGKRVAAAVAAQGLPAGQLPEGTANNGTVESQVSALRAKLETATPIEKSKIATQIKELLAKK